VKTEKKKVKTEKKAAKKASTKAVKKAQKEATAAFKSGEESSRVNKIANKMRKEEGEEEDEKTLSQVMALMASEPSSDISRTGKSVTEKMLKSMDKRAKKWEGKAKKGSAGLGIKPKKHRFTAKEIGEANTVAKVARSAYDEERGAAAVAHIADNAAYRAMEEAIAGASAKIKASVDRDVANDQPAQDQLRKLAVGKKKSKPAKPTAPAAPSPPAPVLDPEAHAHLHHKSDEGHPEMEPASHGGHDESNIPGEKRPEDKGTLKEVNDVLKSNENGEDKLAKIRSLVGDREDSEAGKAAPASANGLSDEERQGILNKHENDLSHVKDELARSKEQIRAAREDYHNGVQKQIENEMVRAAKKSVLEAKRHATEVAKNAGVKPATASAQATKAIKAAAQQPDVAPVAPAAE